MGQNSNPTADNNPLAPRAISPLTADFKRLQVRKWLAGDNLQDPLASTVFSNRLQFIHHKLAIPWHSLSKSLLLMECKLPPVLWIQRSARLCWIWLRWPSVPDLASKYSLQISDSNKWRLNADSNPFKLICAENVHAHNPSLTGSPNLACYSPLEGNWWHPRSVMSKDLHSIIPIQ